MADKKRIINILTLFIPPLLVMAVLLILFKVNAYYPFGENSVSWCDMNQQVVPLMIDFKDILDGKSSIFLNFENAGGMNLLGVFFFYLSSPFTFLVKFVEKENVILFVNILVMLKLMTSSLTAMIYFKSCHKNLDSGMAVALSVMYGLCGYGMIFYQNISWLDMMYLFPLLMLSLTLLINKQKIIPYILSLTALVAANFYISYMVVVFLLLFMGLYVFMNSKENVGQVCIKFIIGSALAALLSAVVWLPSFLQYSSSARGVSIVESLANSKFITSYDTIMPLIYCSAFILVVMLVDAFGNEQREKRLNMYLYLYVLTLIPVFIEPINKMWHTGNYMSFSGRYTFITIFIGLICCAYFLSKNHLTKPVWLVTVASIVPIIVIALLLKFGQNFITENFDTLVNYVRTLWGSQDSWLKITQLFVITAACYAVIYLLYKKGMVAKKYFAVLLCAVALIEGYSNARFYIAATEYTSPDNVALYQRATELADKIEDDSFYRVKTSSKLMHYNLIGSLGYPSISHYTSLTSQDYLFTMKRLGYTSVWMEAGSCGGTSFTDALLSIGYEITDSSNTNNSVYSNKSYSINKLPQKAGLGIVTSNDLSDKEEIPAELERSEVQQYIYSSLFNDNQLVYKYLYENKSESLNINNEYSFSGTGSLNYNIYIDGKQTLYFDCFDEMTTNLSEPTYNSFSIYVNGRAIETSYPYNKNNGVLYLGEFENDYVSIQVNLLKSVECSSFGVFGVNEDVLTDALQNAASVNFQRDKGSLYGTYTAQENQTCFLAVPYDSGFTIKVNGEKVDYQKSMSAFISFPLEQGENEIEITYTPNGFTFGLIISIIGLALILLYIKFNSKIKISGKLSAYAYYGIGAVGIVVLVLIYLIPVLINIFE